MAEHRRACVLLVQLSQVRSSPAGKAVPSGCEPVRMSCRFGVSPRPLTTSPFSLSAVCLVRLLLAVQLVDILGDDSPLALLPGTVADAVARVDGRAAVGGLRAQIGVPGRLPAPAACASCWQCDPRRPARRDRRPCRSRYWSRKNSYWSAAPARRPARPLPGCLITTAAVVQTIAPAFFVMLSSILSEPAPDTGRRPDRRSAG